MRKLTSQRRRDLRAQADELRFRARLLLARRVAIPTESQVEGRAPVLVQYLGDEIAPSLQRLGFDSRIFENPVRGGPILIAERREAGAATTVLGYNSTTPVELGDMLVLARAASHVPSALLKALQREIPRSWIAVEAKRLEGKSASPLARVTPAERRVLEKICEGKTSPQIALELGRSPSTIRNQTISLFRTLGVHTRAGLVALVARERSTD